MRKLLILFIILTLSGCGCHRSEPAVAPATTPEPAPVTVTLTAVGDNLIHSPIYKQANAYAGGDGYDFSYAYINVRDYIDSDINIINQETPIGGEELGISSYPSFNSPYELGDELISMGFNVINHANNHFYDAAAEGVNNTTAYWQDKPVSVIGVYDDSTAVIEKNGLTFGFAAYTYGSNSGIRGESIYSISYMKKDIIRQELTDLRSRCDILIVSFHWGEEYTMEENDEQTMYAQIAADCNSDLVIGHHPHVIQPIKTLTRSDGRLMPVAYSLGNFISSQEVARTMLGGMLKAEFTGVPGNAELSALGFIPLVTHYGSNFSKNTVYLWDNYSPEKAALHGIDGFDYDYICKLIEDTIDNKYLSVGHEMLYKPQE